jgi:hypothetical protein
LKEAPRSLEMSEIEKSAQECFLFSLFVRKREVLGVHRGSKS